MHVHELRRIFKRQEDDIAFFGSFGSRLGLEESTNSSFQNSAWHFSNLFYPLPPNYERGGYPEHYEILK
jgi:hypothetical protein